MNTNNRREVRPARVSPSQLIQLLAAAIAERWPILITGAPGVGKTAISDQAAEIAGAHVIESHPAVEDPTVPAGMPWPDAENKVATFYPFGQMKEALDATELTVWKLEDFGQATNAVQASYMQLLLAGRINNHVLPPCVTFIATTNRRVDRANVGGILEPVKSRFVSIVELVPSNKDWLRWAGPAGIEPEMLAFHQLRGDELLFAFEPTADMTNSPTPRSWANADRILKRGLPKTIENEALIGAVGEAATVEFQAFRTLYKELPNIDAILADPNGQDIPDSPNVQWALATGLTYKANEQNFGRIATWAQRLADAGMGEMGAFLVTGIVRRLPEVQNSTEYVRLMTSEFGDLLDGSYAE